VSGRHVVREYARNHLRPNAAWERIGLAFIIGFRRRLDSDCQNPGIRSRGVTKSGVHVLGI
jgi:hypothetical protein